MVVLNRALRTVAAVLATALALSQVLAAQASENAIKAAYLYNFTKFIDWPESAFPAAASSFSVCVFAEPGFRRELKAILINEFVRGRPITITEFENGDDLKGCHLVYFGAEHLDRSARRLPSLKQTPVLTVGEGERFLQQGGLIAFQLEGSRLRFDISKRGVEAAGLIVSSKLFRVARQIHGVPAP